MTEADHKLSIERIAIAFRAPGAERDAVDTATTLAKGFHAEVSGVFIEDLEMLRAAQLPIALELCRTTNLIRPVISSEIELALNSSAAAARRIVSDTAQKIGTKWTFSIVRQHIASAILELAKATDVTVYAIETLVPQRPRSVKTSSTMPSLQRETIVVFLDHSAASKRALTIAKALSETLHMPITPIIIATNTADSEKIYKILEDKDASLTRHVELLQCPQFAMLVSAARSHQPAAVVLPISILNGLSQRINELEATLGRSIVIVR